MIFAHYHFHGGHSSQFMQDHPWLFGGMMIVFLVALVFARRSG